MIQAWHFLYPGSNLRDGREAPADGKWLKHDGPVVPCKSGLHASTQAIDALNYAPYAERIVACRVELRGTIVEHGDPVDKLAASERRILWRLDGETTDRVLREFARWCASQVLHLWDAPQVVQDYLATGDESLRAAAWAAAWVATGAAARDAVGTAVRATTGDAAGTAARDTAGAAAWAAAGTTAGTAARDAAWAAARAAQSAGLERLLTTAHGAA